MSNDNSTNKDFSKKLEKAKETSDDLHNRQELLCQLTLQQAALAEIEKSNLRDGNTEEHGSLLSHLRRLIYGMGVLTNKLSDTKSFFMFLKSANLTKEESTLLYDFTVRCSESMLCFTEHSTIEKEHDESIKKKEKCSLVEDQVIKKSKGVYTMKPTEMLPFCIFKELNNKKYKSFDPEKYKSNHEGNLSYKQFKVKKIKEGTKKGIMMDAKTLKSKWEAYIADLEKKAESEGYIGDWRLFARQNKKYLNTKKLSVHASWNAYKKTWNLLLGITKKNRSTSEAKRVRQVIEAYESDELDEGENENKVCKKRKLYLSESSENNSSSGEDDVHAESDFETHVDSNSSDDDSVETVMHVKHVEKGKKDESESASDSPSDDGLECTENICDMKNDHTDHETDNKNDFNILQKESPVAVQHSMLWMADIMSEDDE